MFFIPFLLYLFPAFRSINSALFCPAYGPNRRCNNKESLPINRQAFLPLVDGQLVATNESAWPNKRPTHHKQVGHLTVSSTLNGSFVGATKRMREQNLRNVRQPANKQA